MKAKFTIFPALFLGSMILLSCLSKNKLENAVEGTWTNTTPVKVEMSAPVNIPDFVIYGAELQSTYTFSKPTDGKGSIDITAIGNIYAEPNARMQEENPVNVDWENGLGAIITLKGSYDVVSGDQLRFDYDENSVTINVDSKGTMNVYDNIDNLNDKLTDSYSNSVRKAVADAMRPHILNQLVSLSRLDDIKLTDWQMEGRCGVTNYHFNKVFDGGK